jgi:hypothetical protein
MHLWSWIALIWGASIVIVLVLYWQTMRHEKRSR